ncbi:N-acetyltransferase [Bacteroidales bacterium]|nr:N-acetyltransferase [Bacteroidales bacterium]
MKFYINQLQTGTTSDAEDLNIIQDIYTNSFCEDERRDFVLFLDLLENEKSFFVDVIKDEGQTKGFISSWMFDNFRYIEHFAIASNLRGKGLGKKALSAWIAKSELPVVLEVELPEDDISHKRIVFYQKMGFHCWQIPYIQPAYAPEKKAVPMFLMTYGAIDLNSDFERVKNKLHKEVYKL